MKCNVSAPAFREWHLYAYASGWSKVEAIAAYGSQVVKRPYLRESLLRATAEYWGRFAGYGLVEPLEVMRESA